MNVNLRLAGAGACAILRLAILSVIFAVCSIMTLRASLTDPRHTGMADPVALEQAFDRFASGGQGELLVLSLANLRGLSAETVNAGGTVTIELAGGDVRSVVRGLPEDGLFDLWLVDNRPGAGHSSLAEASDRLMNVGRFKLGPEGHCLSVRLDHDTFRDFFPDRAFVVRADEHPTLSFVLTGSSSLFARLQHHQGRFADEAAAEVGFEPTARAARAADFERIVAHGRQLFLNETFNGNGRTCGTCHVEANNFTLDPGLIATLPPDNPLFVAETNPALASLENPDLMRRFGLILVNADGFFPDARGPQFVLRATQNIQALANSSAPPPDGSIDFTVVGPNPNPTERLGWGNDGAALRDFALVAIAQHAPQTLHRVPGADFRLPTDEELDALAAYQLSLGRQEDFDLSGLSLKSPLARSGQAFYLDTGNLQQAGHKNCNACHFNGGGTAAMSFNPPIPDLDGAPRGANMTAETNVNAIPLALSLGVPRDGGFGQVFLTDVRSFGNRSPVLPIGLEGFNSPPVVESADTGPFFHNHTVADLESAVAFYGTPAFQTSIFGRVIPVSISADPNDPEVQAIGAFLRVLNALENIRSAINVAERGRRMKRAGDMRDLAGLSGAEVLDAIQVLSEGALANSLEPAILSARARLHLARLALDVATQLQAPQAMDNLFDVAVKRLRAARGQLASPATLPPSFRN
jgi:cytochrome c peroxidase